jgi:biopolymer transport protein ExbD
MSAQNSTSKKIGGRRVRSKTEENRGLSITSLLDVLTIILVFLIKNVSMEAVKISELPDMRYPTTITTEKLLDTEYVLPVKLYQDRVLIGQHNSRMGTPDDLISDSTKRGLLQQFFENFMAEIPAEQRAQACVVIQADKYLRCIYLTEIIRVATYTDYPNIYFATIEDPDWLSDFRPASPQ